MAEEEEEEEVVVVVVTVEAVEEAGLAEEEVGDNGRSRLRDLQAPRGVNRGEPNHIPSHHAVVFYSFHLLLLFFSESTSYCSASIVQV